MPINYEKQTYVNGSGATPLSADRLNHNENGTKAAADAVDALGVTVGDITQELDGRLSEAALSTTIDEKIEDALDGFEPGSGLVVVYHLANASYPRPATSNSVMWVGSVVPTAFAAGDILAAPVGSDPVDPGPEIPVSGLVSHHRAVDIPGADGGAVTSWVNRVAGGPTLSVEGSPTLHILDGKRYVSVDGVDDALIGVLDQPQPSTTIVVGRFTRLTSGDYLVGTTQSGTNRNVMANASGKFNLYAGNPQLASTVNLDTSWHVYRAQFGGASSANAVDANVVTGALGTEARRGIAVGKSEATTPGRYPVEVAEIIIYDRALTSGEVSSILAALQAYYAELM